MHNNTYTLTLSCPDRVGIVAEITGFIASHQGWIIEANHYADQATITFFMRQVILKDSLPFSLDVLRELLTPIASKFKMKWNVIDNTIRKRIVILVSKMDHCLVDLLYRWRTKEYAIDIPCVISNHLNLKDFVEGHNIVFHHVSITKENKDSVEIWRRGSGQPGS